jgi:hypothetical protein
MNRNSKVAAAVALACCVTSVCASQTSTEKQFGNAVRQVTQGQIYDGGAALSPSRDAVTGGDPGRLENVINVHRGDVAQPQQFGTSSNLSINSGTRNP